jgi:hypothetical protein
MRKLEKLTLKDIIVPVILNKVTSFREVELFEECEDEEYYLVLVTNSSLFENTNYAKKKSLITGVSYWYSLDDRVLDQIILGDYTHLPVSIKDLISNSNKDFTFYTDKIRAKSKIAIDSTVTDLTVALRSAKILQQDKTGTLITIRQKLVDDLNDQLGLKGNDELPVDVEIIPQFTLKKLLSF